MSDARAAAAAEAAQTIRDQACEHKRLANHHRRQAQLLMQRLADLERAGIRLPPATQPKEAQS